MTRCLILMHSFGGGAESLALCLARALDRQAMYPVVACMRHIPDLARNVPPTVSFFMPEHAGSLHAIKNALAVWRLARHSDIVLGSLELQSIMWAALFAPGRTVAWLHKDVKGYLAHKSKAYACIYRTLLGWALNRCQTVACVSQGIRTSSELLWPQLKSRLRVVWNPLDTERIRARSQAPVPAALQPLFHHSVILGAGRLEPQKAFHLLLEAHAILLQRGVEHSLCILGEGSERPRLENEIRRLGIQNTAFLPGFMDPLPLMARADVLAVSSLFEGFPLVILEALCLGLPVVSADCPSGPGEILRNGLHGRLVPCENARALADALQSTLANPPSHAHREAGKRRVEAYALSNTVKQWETLLTRGS